MKRVIRRKGFAIILVAALAGLVFLLGASLVAVSQLQSASANYDQRVRLAREHARAALDMAVAELQEKLGKDVAVSYSADVLSAATVEDFKDAREGAVREPFWTGASDGGGPVWLVTRGLDGTVEEPTGDFTGPEIELLGKGTVGDNDTLKVKVPTEAISVKGVDGYDSETAKTIGNYAYWVGDLGVKASYAWYDQLDAVSHDEYGTTEYDPDSETEGDEWFDRQARLRQMTIAKPALDIVDTNLDSPTPTNPERIDTFVNDFQFREKFGASSATDWFLSGLTEGEAEEYFQDFTPLSKGLLVDSERGGLKLDLTSETPLGDGTYSGAYASYRNLAKSGTSSADFYDEYRFPLRTSGVPIRPVITQFNLNYAVSFTGGVSDPQTLTISFEATAELWNPYSSDIDFEGGSLLIEVKGLPELLVWQNESGEEAPPDYSKDLMDAGSEVEFEITKFSDTPMRAGEILVVAGPQAGSTASPYGMGEGQIDRAVISEDSVSLKVPELTSFDLAFSEEAELTVYIWLKKQDGTKTFIADYGFPSAFTLTKTNFDFDSLPTTPRFGFSWKIRDSAIPLSGAYHPFIVKLNAESLEGWDPEASADTHLESAFGSAVSELLGYNPTSGESLDTKYDLPVIYLPKQELLNVGTFSLPSETDNYESTIGGVGETGVLNENDFFDKYFFSSLPDSVLNWDSEDRIPNSFYKPKSGMDIASIVDGTDPPAQDLFVQGMFNVHSTSIYAWAAILKGAPVSKHPYWSTIFPDDTYLFMNHPLGGEDVNVLDPNPAPAVGSNEAKRVSMKKNAFALTEDQVNALAALIVKEIRTYVQGSGGSFDSLEEFVNSGVLQNAIDALNGDATLKVNPSWVIPGTPAEFRQSTILNLISGILSVRSDTFLVRAYGDAVNPANGKIWARAYCEAILQRTHEQYGNVIDAGENKSAEIDRKFEVVAFRWLAPSEI